MKVPQILQHRVPLGKIPWCLMQCVPGWLVQEYTSPISNLFETRGADRQLSARDPTRSAEGHGVFLKVNACDSGSVSDGLG